MAVLRDIRAYAVEHMPRSTFAHVIMSEPDEITEAEFKAKIPVWFAILEKETESGADIVEVAPIPAQPPKGVVVTTNGTERHPI